jgi:adenylate cyclase
VTPSLRTQRLPVAGGAAALAIMLAADLLLPNSWREDWRETAFDLVLAADHSLRPAADDHTRPRVVVVDIDRRSLDAVGPWPWPRATVAGLIDAIATAKPAVAAVDILFVEHDARLPAALARQLGGAMAQIELSARADQPTDGDKVLARAVGQLPLVLGFVLDPKGHSSLPQAPVVVRGSPSLDGLWSAAGAVAPPSAVVERASGIGALSLPANNDGVVRHVPLLVGVGGYVLPGLALESVRIARKASTYLLQSAPPTLATADLKVPLTPHGLLRLLPAAPERHAMRTISAIDVLEGKDGSARLAGAVVLVGGSAPELGGLRATAADPLTPSVHIQADAIEQMEAGRFPREIGAAGAAQLLAVAGLGALAVGASAALPPIFGALAVVAMIALTWMAAIATAFLTDRLMDPLPPSFAVATVFVIASVISFAVTQRREVLVRRRFEQHLAPAVVRRIVENPSLVKLAGERREVTALFTDVEGFTAMTHRADPEELIAVLDSYFEGVCAMIFEHGGMVGKIVGDAAHALFNAPLDLADHPRRAVECAIAIRSWTETYRRLPAPAAIGLGRTRIGVETGQAIVGDVGLRSKLDYTAHGDAVNAAARLEPANKELGSAICVGPAAAARCDAGMFRPLGTIKVQGLDAPMAVFEPWPIDTPPDWRKHYLAAFELVDRDPMQAAALFEKLAIERPDDAVVKRMANRLRAQAM